MPETTDQSEVSAEVAAQKAYSAAAEKVGITKAPVDASPVEPPAAASSSPSLPVTAAATLKPVVDNSVVESPAPVPVAAKPVAATVVKARKAAKPKPASEPVAVAAKVSKPAEPVPVTTVKPRAATITKAKPAEPKPAKPKVVKPKSTKPAATPVAAITPQSPSPTLTPTAKIKEKFAMATATKTVTVPDVMKIVTEAQDKAKEAFADVQGKAKEAAAEVEAKAKLAYAKGSEVAGKVGTIVKSNVDAVVESGKTLGVGLKELGETTVEDSRAAVQTFADDLKDFASIKSPAEFFHLQGKLAARNIDAYFAYATKSGKAVKDLTEKAIAPISAQIKANVAAARKAA